jgi:ribosome-associated protein
MIRVTDAIGIDERDLQERFVRSSGPGGQNVNKVSTAVELSFDVGRAPWTDELKGRIAALAGTRLTTDGILRVESREHRTQSANRRAARERLVALLREAARPIRTRRATRPHAKARQQRLAAKKRRGAIKALRSERDGD